MSRTYGILFALVAAFLIFLVSWLVLEITLMSSLALTSLSLIVLLFGYYSPHRITTEKADISLGIYLLLLFVSFVYLGVYTLGMALTDIRCDAKLYTCFA